MPMLIVGAGGFAREVLQVLRDSELKESILFYDDVNINSPDRLYGQFIILKNIEQVKVLFDLGNRNYLIGVGNPSVRQLLREKFDDVGGSLCSSVSPFAKLGSYDVSIGNGCNILSGVKISNSVQIGECCLLYYGVTVTHDVILGDFVEISPNVTLLGRSEVGDLTHIGANSTILPKVKIGKNVIIGAGSVVTRDIADNSLAYGVPARVAKKLN